MTRYISILRGINVGGKRKLLMADLKQLYAQLGFKNITTYIQSGNVVFDFNDNLENSQIENTISNAIKNKFDYHVPVIIRNIDEYKLLFNNNPFIIDDNFNINQLYITFLKTEPLKENKNDLDIIDFSPTRFKVCGKEIYIFSEERSIDSKLTHNIIEKKLKVDATTRNWKTTTKLYEIATS
jgi:uncharacterized protein (DUF1697 family)